MDSAPLSISVALLAAVLTPSADVVSQLMMMAPLVVLYYTAVAVAYALERRTAGAAGDGS
jgi:Sec-independent protein secretion pathway component TatC